MNSRPSQQVREHRKRKLSVSLIGGVGSILAGFEVWHAFQMETVSGKLIQAVLPLSVAVSILYASYWLSRSEFDSQSTFRIVLWFIAGMVGMTIVVGWIIAHQLIRGIGFHHWYFVIAGSMTVGGVVGFLLGVYDERSRLHKKRIIAERTKVEAEQEKLTLLNQVLRHNILNAVNVIEGRAETQKGRIDGDNRRHLDVITSRSADIVNLIEKVHTFIERVSTDGQPDPTSTDLSSVLHTEIEKARRAYPEANISGEVPANLRVLADTMLAEVFENLLMNAVEHNPTEEPVVTVSVEQRESEVVVSVADNGPGIPDSQKEQIFAWNPEATSRPATGVGLSLVETLVDQYGGSIWIEDNDPGGSVFNVELSKVSEPSVVESPAEQTGATTDDIAATKGAAVGSTSQRS